MTYKEALTGHFEEVEPFSPNITVKDLTTIHREKLSVTVSEEAKKIDREKDNFSDLIKNSPSRSSLSASPTQYTKTYFQHPRPPPFRSHHFGPRPPRPPRPFHYYSSYQPRPYRGHRPHWSSHYQDHSRPRPSVTSYHHVSRETTHKNFSNNPRPSGGYFRPRAQTYNRNRFTDFRQVSRPSSSFRKVWPGAGGRGGEGRGGGAAPGSVPRPRVPRYLETSSGRPPPKCPTPVVSIETAFKTTSNKKTETSSFPLVQKVDELIYLPTRVGRREYTVHFIHETQRKKRSERESSPLPSVKKVDELIYLPTCVGRKEYTVHFFPELFLMPSYSFDMVFYEKIALVLSSKGKT